EDEDARKTAQVTDPPRFVALGDPANQIGSSAQLDGESFRLTKLRPGEYQVTLPGAFDPPMYVRSMQYGEANLDGARLDLRSGAAAPLGLHVASAKGSVSGTVRDDKGPVPQAVVRVLDLTNDSRVLYQSQSGLDGSYSVKGLAPGKYRILAAGAK